jgi:hypothetical protein
MFGWDDREKSARSREIEWNQPADISGHGLSAVMPGLEPGIHVFKPNEPKTWMAGSSPAMTA